MRARGHLIVWLQLYREGTAGPAFDETDGLGNALRQRAGRTLFRKFQVSPVSFYDSLFCVGNTIKLVHFVVEKNDIGCFYASQGFVLEIICGCIRYQNEVVVTVLKFFCMAEL